MKLRYAILEHDPKLEEKMGPVDVGSLSKSNLPVVIKCAEHYWYQHNGWDTSWPLTFVLFDERCESELVRFSVKVAPTPCFEVFRLPEEE